MTDATAVSITQRIRDLREQILIHSRIYYVLNRTMISDELWDGLAAELRDIQLANPKDIRIGFYDDAFADWNELTGRYLPVDDAWVIARVYREYPDLCGNSPMISEHELYRNQSDRRIVVPEPLMDQFDQLQFIEGLSMTYEYQFCEQVYRTLVETAPPAPNYRTKAVQLASVRDSNRALTVYSAVHQIPIEKRAMLIDQFTISLYREAKRALENGENND